MAKIIIDPGHGGRDLGASYNGRLEKDDNLNLALAVGKILENNGYNVVYTRRDDVYDSPVQKANIANAAGGDLFVSFHRNSSAVPGQYEGVQTLVYDDSGIKAELARKISDNLAQAGFKNLGIDVRPDLAVLRRTNMPAVLIETGFINNEGDNKIYDENFNEIAEKIALAIMETASVVGGVQYYVQTGLFRNENNANELANQLWYLGYPAQIGQYKEYYQVKVGPYTSLQQAAAVERELRNKGFSTLIVQS